MFVIVTSALRTAPPLASLTVPEIRPKIVCPCILRLPQIASKRTAITVAVVRDAQALVEQHVVKASDIKGPIRAGRVWGWYFLPKSIELGVAEMIVDLRQLHTVRLDLLTALCVRGQRRARLQPLYREHLAKHFADTYSRIGLPEPYPTD